MFGIFEPFFAFIATITLFKGAILNIDLHRTTEEGVRIFMGVLFSVYYIIKIIRYLEMKDDVSEIKNRLDELEKLGKDENI